MEIKNKVTELYISPSQPALHVLASTELHSSFHMAANCYLENFFHPVTLSSPWGWAYVDTSYSSREPSWPLGVSHLHSQTAGVATDCALCWPRLSLTNPRCGSRTSTAEGRSQKMHWTQPPCFRESESLTGQTGTAPCQLNAVSGTTNIDIGLISPEALKSLQSLLALATPGHPWPPAPPTGADGSQLHIVPFCPSHLVPPSPPEQPPGQCLSPVSVLLAQSAFLKLIWQSNGQKSNKQLLFRYVYIYKIQVNRE